MENIKTTHIIGNDASFKKSKIDNLIGSNTTMENIKTTHIIGNDASFKQSKIDNLIVDNGSFKNIKTDNINLINVNTENIETKTIDANDIKVKNINSTKINTEDIITENIKSYKGFFELLEVTDIDTILMNANKLISEEFESKIGSINDFNSMNATIDNISCKQIESNEFITLSDINQKKNIIYNNLNYKLLDLLNIIQFHYKNEDDNAQPHFGFIAQEVEANYPNLVVRDSQNNLRVKYIELIPLLLMYNKALKNDINRIYELLEKK